MPPRTKACATCRKKRIKCDATLPQCLMCIRTGKQCPGPLDGPLIIDMTNTAGVGMKKRTNALLKPAQAVQKSFDKSPRDLVQVLLPQLPQRAFITEAFYANFLIYFTSDGEGMDLQNRRTWLHLLPNLSSDGSNPALMLALQATAFVYCGTETGNISMVQGAWVLYGQALGTHARTLRSKPEQVTAHMVFTSVMLSLFEAISFTTADAYREHVSGAAKMLEVTGPGQCLQGVLCQLFFHIRTQMAFVYLTTRKSQGICVKKILLETLSYQQLPTFQRLMNHIGVLAEIYVQETSPRSQEQLINLEVYLELKSEIDELWLEYKEQAEKKGEMLSWFHDDGRMKYRDAFTAIVIAYFSAARVLFTTLVHQLATTFPDFTDHHASILDCATFLGTHIIGCAYMRMATPLYLVALHSPKLEQRNWAISNFEGWQKGSMAGISALALERIYEK